MPGLLSLPAVPHSRPVRWGITGATCLAILLLAAGAWLGYAGLRGVRAAAALSDEVRQALLATETVLSTLKDAETGQRGFLLTGDPAYLEPYAAARERLDADFGRLEQAVVLGPGYLVWARRMRESAAAKLAELEETVALRRAGNAEAALAVVRTDRGKQLMDALRAEADALQANADDKLAQAQAGSMRWWTGPFGLAVLASLLLALVDLEQRRARRVIAARLVRLAQAEAALRESQEWLHLALDASGLGTWRWEVGEGTEGMACDARCKALFGLASDAAVDYAAWAGAILLEDRAVAEADMRRALDPADPHDDYVCEYRVAHGNGSVLCLAAAGRASFAPDPGAPTSRRVLRIMGTMRDVTAVRAAEAARQRAAALLHTIVETAPGLIYAKDRQGRLLVANAPVLKLIGKPWSAIEGRTDREYLDDKAQAEAVMANDRRIMEGGEAEELEELIGSEGAQPRVWLSTKTPLLGAEGKAMGLVGVSVEITERKRAEERLRLILHELNHRVKNTLATVQAIASQTLRGTDPAIRRTLDARLMALSSAHDVLTRKAWQGAELDDVVSGVLTPHGGREDGRFLVSGPAMRLLPRAALALAMGLHELATNALKYGALSATGGRVGIRWEVTTGKTPRFRLAWTERGGPAVAPPARRGFGTKLVERSLAQDLGGTARIAFAPEGVTCAIEAPLDEVAAPAEVVPFPRVGSLGGG